MSPPHVLRSLRNDDQGQLLLLVLCYAVIAALLVSVVINVSQAYLGRRALLAAADAAALAAANEADLSRLYAPATTQGSGQFLPLDTSVVTDAVENYAARAQLADRFDSFAILGVMTDGTSVTVSFAASMDMPFLNLLSSAYADGYPVRASATARSPVGP